MKRYFIYVLLVFSSVLYASVGDTISFKGVQYVVTADDATSGTYEVRIGRYLSERIYVPAEVQLGLKSYAVTAVPRYFDSTTCALTHYQKIDYSRCEHLISLAWQATDETDIDTLILPPNVENWPTKAFFSVDPSEKRKGKPLLNPDKLQKGIHRIFSSGQGNPNLPIRIYSCGALQELDLSSYTVPIEADFEISGCPFLEKCILPNTLKRGDSSDGLFGFCIRLKYFNMPDSLENIGVGFAFCVPISHCHLGPKVKDIGVQSLYGWQYMDSVSVDPANPWFCAVDGVLFSHDTTTLIHYPYSRRADTYILPEPTRVVMGMPFRIDYYPEEYARLWRHNLPPSAGSLKTLVVNEGLEEIRTWAGFYKSSIRKIRNLENSHLTYISTTSFDGSNIDTLIMPATLKELDCCALSEGQGSRAFAYMRSLRCIDFSRVDSLYFMGQSTMEGDINLDSLDMLHCSLLTRFRQSVCKGDSSLRYLALPRYIDTIGQEAFSGCVSLNKVVCPALTPIRLTPGMKVFEGVNTSACELVVPSRSVALYQQAPVWKDFRITSDGLYVVEGLPNDTIGGTVSGTGAFRQGEIATLTATPDEDYEFLGWSDGTSDNPRQIAATQDTTVYAVFRLISGLTPATKDVPDNVHKRIIDGNVYIQKGEDTYSILGEKN